MIRKTLVALAVSAGVVAGTMGVASASVSPTNVAVTTNRQAVTLTGLTASTLYVFEQCWQDPASLAISSPGTTFVDTTYCANKIPASTDSTGTFASPSNWGIFDGQPIAARGTGSAEECAPSGTTPPANVTLYTTCFLRVVPDGQPESAAQYVQLDYPTSTAVPETPYAIILPIAGLGVLGIAFLIVRNRRRAVAA